MVWWLKLCASNVECTSSIPGMRNTIPHAGWQDQRKQSWCTLIWATRIRTAMLHNLRVSIQLVPSVNSTPAQIKWLYTLALDNMRWICGFNWKATSHKDWWITYLLVCFPPADSELLVSRAQVTLALPPLPYHLTQDFAERIPASGICLRMGQGARGGWPPHLYSSFLLILIVE